MTFNIGRSALIALAILLASSRWCAGAVSYSYVANVASNTSSTFSISPASAGFTLNIYLQENLTDKSASVLASEGGLLGAGFTVSLASGSGISLTNVTPAATFGMTAKRAVTGTSVRLVEAYSGTTGGVTAVADSGGYEILLGTVTVQPNNTLTAASFLIDKDTVKQENDQTLTAANYYDLDVTQTTPANAAYSGEAATPASTFTIVTPEPVSACWCGLSLLALRRRQRRSR